MPAPGALLSGSLRLSVAALRGFTRFVSQLPAHELAGMDARSTMEAGFVDFLHHEVAGVLRAAVLLMAAISITEQGGDQDRAAELCDLAFLNATDAADHLALSGVLIAPDISAAPGYRGREILEAVEEARAALAPEDIDTLSRFRLRDLR